MTKIKFEVILDTANEVEMEALNSLLLNLSEEVATKEVATKEVATKEVATKEVATKEVATKESPEAPEETAEERKESPEAPEETAEERKERKRQEANARKRKKRAEAKAAREAEEAREAAEDAAEAKAEAAEKADDLPDFEQKTDLDLINKARKLVSKNVGEHRDEIKEELARMGARNVSSVPEDKLEDFCSFLELL